MDKIIYGIMIVLLVWFVFKQFTPVKGVKNLNGKEFENELKRSENNSQLIDVREIHEFRQGRIVGAKNIPLGEIGQKLEQISTDKPVFLYCRSGMRSKQAGKILSRNGYSQIYNLNGGIMAWSGKVAK